jgi:hypothetical protein
VPFGRLARTGETAYEAVGQKMTAQIPDLIRIGDEERSLLTNPLGEYFRKSGRRSPFESKSSALWRGYVAHWKLEDGVLYLVEISGTADVEPEELEADMQDLFPNSRGPVSAVWYTGDLRIPHGEVLEYVHLGYESTYEEEEIIRILNGQVVGSVRIPGTKILRRKLPLALAIAAVSAALGGAAFGVGLVRGFAPNRAGLGLVEVGLVLIGVAFLREGILGAVDTINDWREIGRR